MSIRPNNDDYRDYLPDNSVDRGVNALLLGLGILLGFALAILGLTAVMDSTADSVNTQLRSGSQAADTTSADAPQIFVTP